MIDNNELKQIAQLAKLTVAEDALAETVADLNNILTLAEQLASVDTDDITPMAHPLHVSQPLRADEVIDEDESTLFQSIAPQTDKQHYLVPTVIE